MDTRIGLEDTLVLPDGSVAPDNAALVAAAVALAHGG
ncbi:MAG: 3-keto-5-aminohexanoate cleavage protein [Actinomycetes bacterium]